MLRKCHAKSDIFLFLPLLLPSYIRVSYARINEVYLTCHFHRPPINRLTQCSLSNLSLPQTPHQQTDRLDLNKHPDRICGGGGFGPVTDDGYGVSYMIAGEDTIFFHISCKKSCSHTDSHKFGATLAQSLNDMRDLFSKDK
ncbi:carnitine O-palmitoyltransferase 1, liver isoform-like [Elysia marginata]|uniref:Carnitine O-palmitoyltransferase 1, liver isoform-like n=1 Tax=Elysia marginata TaxID=1093978 RepID=A0AAV4EZ81_9GAST|nr:carnitine O-palmitoyltransferase 1, liver isoform-like [Elysia marginata]